MQNPEKDEPYTEARVLQLNYEVLLFLSTSPNVHENMMLPKSDMFLFLINQGPMIKQRDY